MFASFQKQLILFIRMNDLRQRYCVYQIPFFSKLSHVKKSNLHIAYIFIEILKLLLNAIVSKQSHYVFQLCMQHTFPPFNRVRHYAYVNTWKGGFARRHFLHFKFISQKIYIIYNILLFSHRKTKSVGLKAVVQTKTIAPPENLVCAPTE
jgi:hypothetical protein